ncbi:hypothetical protein CS954_11500 [Bacillus siamensis]|nr:hypothetical protein CS954_11500 [Bacillus siamensis]
MQEVCQLLKPVKSKFLFYTARQFDTGVSFCLDLFPFVSFSGIQKRPVITRSLTMIDVFISSEIF